MFEVRLLPRRVDAALQDVTADRVSVRLSALADLVRHGDSPQRPKVLEAVQRALTEDADESVRAAAALALADLGATEAVAVMLRRLPLERPRVRQMILTALGELASETQNEAVDALRAARDAAEPAVRFAALSALNRVSPLQARPELARALDDGDPEVRYLALRLLAEVEADGSQAELSAAAHRALSDPAQNVRTAAAMWMAATGDRTALDGLARAINAGVRLPEPGDQQRLFELAGELGARAAVPGLRRQAYGFLGFGSGRFAWQARVALARLGDRRARRDLLRGLRSRNPHVRAISAAACGQAQLTEARGAIAVLLERGQLDPTLGQDVLAQLGVGSASAFETSE